MTRKNSKRKGGSARSGLEPESCGHRSVERVSAGRIHPIQMSSDVEPRRGDDQHTPRYGESADPAKMTNSRMALIKRGPSSLKLSANP